MNVLLQLINNRLCLHHSFNSHKPTLRDDITESRSLLAKMRVVLSAKKFVKIQIKQ